MLASRRDGRRRPRPAFDQVPMLYAPTNNGQLPERRFSPPAPAADAWESWAEAVELATGFWRRAAEDTRLSEGMRAVARTNADAVDRAALRVGVLSRTS